MSKYMLITSFLHAMIMQRSLNEHHVTELAESFEKNFKPYTTLIGHMWQCFNKWSDDTRKKMCGSSGRKPHQSGIATTCEIKWMHPKREISVCLYGRLSKFDPGSGSVSCFKHNKLHENSQELSFSEKVLFFHKVLLDCERKFAGQTQLNGDLRLLQLWTNL